MTTPSLRAALELSPFALIVALTACGSSVIGGGGASGTGAGNQSNPPPGARTGVAFDPGNSCYYGSTSTSTSSGWGGTGGTGGTTTWSSSSSGTGGTGGWTGTGGTGGTGGWTDGTGGTYGSTDGCGYPTGSLSLQIGDPSPECSSAGFVSTDCGGHFVVTIHLQPELLHPGAVPLSSPSVNAYFSETGPSYADDPSSCPGGGGSFISGTLTIQTIDDSSVWFTLTGTEPFLLGAPSADGDYVVPRCY